MASSPLPLHGPKIRQSKAVCLYQLLLFCVKQHMQLIFCQPTVVADGTLHAQCPQAKQVPLAINTSVSVSLHVPMPSPVYLTAHCCVLQPPAATHLYRLIYLTKPTKLLILASACPVLYRPRAQTLQIRPSCNLRKAKSLQ